MKILVVCTDEMLNMLVYYWSSWESSLSIAVGTAARDGWFFILHLNGAKIYSYSRSQGYHWRGDMLESVCAAKGLLSCFLWKSHRDYLAGASTWTVKEKQNCWQCTIVAYVTFIIPSLSSSRCSWSCKLISRWMRNQWCGIWVCS